MSSESNTPTMDPRFLSTAGTHPFTDSSGLSHQSSESLAERDVTFNPAPNDFSPECRRQTFDQQRQQIYQQQQQIYQQQQQQQQQQQCLQRPYAQPQHTHDRVANQMVDRHIPSMFDSPGPASLAGTSGIQPIDPYGCDWYLSQAPRITAFTSMIDDQGQHVASLPDMEWSPPLETRSTLSERSGCDAAKQ
jgi:hypothetical protein